jgi:hypothetical protein
VAATAFATKAWDASAHLVNTAMPVASMPHASSQTVLAYAILDTSDSNAPTTVVRATFVAERALDHYLTNVSNACLTQNSTLLDVTVRVSGVTLIVNRITANAPPHVIYASDQIAPTVFSAGQMLTENREPENVSVTIGIMTITASRSILMKTYVTPTVTEIGVTVPTLATVKNVGTTHTGRILRKIGTITLI